MTAEAILRKLLTRVTVDPVTGCWMWTGGCSQSGRRGVFYAAARIGGGSTRVWRVNRLVLMLTTGPIDHPRRPEEPLILYLERLRVIYAPWESSHTCDRSRCICPDHLGWRGHGENIQEQVARRVAARAAAREQAVA